MGGAAHALIGLGVEVESIPAVEADGKVVLGAFSAAVEAGQAGSGLESVAILAEGACLGIAALEAVEGAARLTAFADKVGAIGA